MKTKKVSQMEPAVASSEILPGTLFWISRTDSASMFITYEDLLARIREAL